MRGIAWIVVVLLSGACTDPSTDRRRGHGDVPTDGGPADDTDDPGPGPGPGTPPAPASVMINEIMPGNGSTINGPDGYSLPDWVEIVNTGVDPVALSRLQLRNDANEVWMGTEYDGEIQPGEHMLIWLGYQEDEEGVWTGWSVGKEDDELVLISDNATVVEEVSWVGIGEDISFARIPDLTGAFVPTAWPTPGDVNGDAPSPTLDPADETLFRTDIVHRIDFDMTGQDANMLNQADRPEVHVGVEIDGVAYEDIGLKLKGSASYDTMNGKPAFIVDMNEWVSGTKFRGLKALKLHNGNVLDPTRVRDHITYKLARDVGLLAPRVGWAEVYCSGIYYGIYMIIEKHDDIMIERWRPGDGDFGMIFEPNEAQGGGSDFGWGNVQFNYEEGPVPIPAAAVNSLDSANALISGAATDDRVNELWNYMDKEKVLTYLAWEAVVGHTDGYKAPNNWRVYINGTTNLIELVPSGAEWTWDSDVSAWSFGGRTGSWCMSNQGCKHDFAQKVLEVADRVEDLGLAAEFQTQSLFLDPIIDKDPRYNSWETVEQARQSTSYHLANNPGQARTQVYATFPDLQP